MKVFIADDSVIVYERLITMLSDIEEIKIIGHAQDAGEAIKSIKKLKPDVVILDIRMPGGSGIELLRHIKKGKRVPIVIVLTNFPYPQYRQRSMDEGADFFFDKSSEFEEVKRVFKRLLQSSDVAN